MFAYSVSLFNKAIFKLKGSRPINIDLDEAIISISFDDVPHSAFKNGKPILDKYSIKATFYITGRCAEKSDDEGEFISLNNVIKLDAEGHDIACHTYSHHDLKKEAVAEVRDDCLKNAKLISGLLASKKVGHFAYPYGRFNRRVKATLSEHYLTMRGVKNGFNGKHSDLNNLLAVGLNSQAFNKKYLLDVIHKTCEKGGWLIFFTHSVTDNPPAYSCTPEQLDWLLEQCVKAKAQTLPVCEAYNLIINQS